MIVVSQSKYSPFMDKYLLRNTSTLQLLEEANADADAADTIKPIILGILGNSTSAKWNRDTISESVMNPILGEIGLPNTILMPTEGVTSILLQIWSDRHNISSQSIDADWIRLGRRARVIRDGRILKESTHLVFFLGTRSDYYEKIAIREAKRGKQVFTIDSKTLEITQLHI